MHTVKLAVSLRRISADAIVRTLYIVLSELYTAVHVPYKLLHSFHIAVLKLSIIIHQLYRSVHSLDVPVHNVMSPFALLMT